MALLGELMEGAVRGIGMLALLIVLAAARPLAGAPQRPPARAVAEVTWLMSNLVPASILVDGQPTEGTNDQLVKLLVASWPAPAAHRYVAAPPLRVWSEIADGRQVCAPGVVRTAEREKIAHFSTASTNAPVGVVVRSEDLARLPVDAAGAVKLSALLTVPGLRGYIESGRSYGAVVDAALATPPADANVRAGTLGVTVQNLLMLAARRIDYIFEYPVMLHYQQHLQPDLAGLKFVPIAGAEALLEGGIACPRTDWGKATIAIIDRLVTGQVATPAYRRILTLYWPDDLVQRHAAAIEEFVARRARQGQDAAGGTATSPPRSPNR